MRCKKNNTIYNAITQNNCEMDTVNMYVLYLYVATVSIKYKANKGWDYFFHGNKCQLGWDRSFRLLFGPPGLN